VAFENESSLNIFSTLHSLLVN